MTMLTEEQKQLVESRKTLRIQRANLLHKRQELQVEREGLLKRRQSVEASWSDRERGYKLNLIHAEVEKLQLEIHELQQSSARCQTLTAEISFAETLFQGRTDFAGVSNTAEMILSMQEKLQKLQEDLQRQREVDKSRREYIVSHKAT